MTESLADRWIRDYEAKHPEKARARNAHSLPPESLPLSPACPLQPRAVPASPLPSPRGNEPRVAQTGSSAFPTTISPASKNTQQVVQAAIALRLEWGLTQAAFAYRLGVKVRTWQEWEQGRRLPSGPARALLERWLATPH